MPAQNAYNAGMRRRQSVQYTIRNIPPAVDAALRRRARSRGKSLNQIALEELSKAAGEDRVFDDLDFLAGSWVADAETDKALAEQRSIDAEMWR